MTNKEKEALKNEIAYRDVMTRKLGKNAKFCFFLFLLFAALAIWGFTGMQDNFLKVSDSIRDIIKWVSLVIAIPTGVFTVLFFVSFRNSKKYVLKQIDKLQGKVK
ncbi:MAG: hypothetical protein EOM11_01835 [Erysipelotrichia bacterium]|nr:hypothetical protein [Erysipelotrichia bacterium]